MSGRIRTVKPEWLEDERMAGLSDAARMLSIALILLADDHGRGRASLPQIAGSVWAYEMSREDGANIRETLAKVREALASLSEARFVSLYEVGGQAYFEIRNWSKHQRVDKPGKPRVPSPDQAKCAKSLDSQNPRESSRESPESSRESRESLATEHRSVGASERRTEEHRIDGASEPRATAAASGRDPTVSYAETAYTNALAARGGRHATRPAEDAPQFRSVAEAALVEARRTSQDVREVLDRWARDWIAGRSSLRVRPSYWAEWVQLESAQSYSRPVAPADSQDWIDDVPDESIFGGDS